MHPYNLVSMSVKRLRAIGMLQARLAQYGDDLDNLATLETADVQVVHVEHHVVGITT
jgi:hypothetical protein